MREQHLAEVGVHHLAALAVGDGERRVLQRQPLHFGSVALLGLERDERRAQRRHGDVQRPCKAIAVAGRAGERVGRAARRHNNAVIAVHAVCLHGKAVALRADGAGRGMHKVHARLGGGAAQRLGDVRRLVRNRKHAVPPLGLERDAVRFKERLDIGWRKCVQRRVQKARVAALHMFEHRVHIAVVADIAAPLTGDAQLFAAKRILLIQRDGSAARGGMFCRHQACGTAADNSNLRHQPCTFA